MTPWLDDGDVQLYHGDALTILQSIWHRLRYGHWLIATLEDTGECLHCALRWNPERGYWEVR